jgi:hypothetical protein
LTFSDYVRHGWQLCAIASGKAPTADRWNTEPISEDVAQVTDGAGLLHSLSGTCALDIDNLDGARAWLAERGVDIDALLEADDAVQISSGRPNRAKLLYRMKRPLRTLKPKASGLELRCATADGKSVQDVLPPSIHPTTKKPYVWAGGMLSDWRNPPAIPAKLLAVWRELTAGETTAPIEAQTISPRIDLAALRKATFKRSPDAPYDEWLKTGMQLHEGTGGAQEGFDIWVMWSKGVKRIKYPGDESLKTHWVSFKSAPGKTVATGAALAAELPAEPDEFPVEDGSNPYVEAETTKAVIEAAEQLTKQQAIEALEQRLVFVYSAERYFDCERQKVIGSDNALEHMFTHMMPRTKGGRLSPIKVLKASSTKRFVDAVGFHPGEGVLFQSGGMAYANNYRNELPEPLAPTALEQEKIEWLFNRIDDVPYRKWLLQFYGHVVQFPGVKTKSAPLIWSDTQGNGKTTLVRMIPSLLVGTAYSREVNSGLLGSDFNDYLLGAWHINLTEFRAGSRGEREAISKKVENWIADDVVSIHPKGLPGYTMPNHFFVTGSSNSEDAAAISNNDRKWAIHELHAPQFTEAEQRWIYHEFLLLPRASAVLRHYFLNLSLIGFAASAKAPETEARQQMVDASTGSDLDMLRTAFEERSDPLRTDVVLTREVVEYLQRNSLAKPNAHRVGRILSKEPYNGIAKQFRSGEGKFRAIIIRNHIKWESANGHQIMAHINGDDAQISVDDDLTA